MEEKGGREGEKGEERAREGEKRKRVKRERGSGKEKGVDRKERAKTKKELEQLSQLGAAEVVQPEFEAALALCTHILGTLGQIDDHLDATMAKIRASHYQSVRRNVS